MITDRMVEAALEKLNLWLLDSPAGRERIRAALAAADAAAWEGIESAPRDGPVTVYGGDVAYPVTASWSGADDESWTLDALGDIHQEIETPTHWRPLPAPPVQS